MAETPGTLHPIHHSKNSAIFTRHPIQGSQPTLNSWSTASKSQDMSLWVDTTKNRTILLTACACLVYEEMGKGQIVMGKNDKNKQRIVQKKIQAQVIMEIVENIKHKSTISKRETVPVLKELTPLLSRTSSLTLFSSRRRG